jgi:predicted lipoprotein with Yx(FWY)xxD motif
MDTTARNRRSRRRSLGRTAAFAMAIGAVSAFVGVGAATAATPTAATEISTAKSSKLGTILVAGNTVYTLKHEKAACDAACVKARPPVVLPQGVTTATAGSGVDASKLGTVTTADGELQITYAGDALYRSAKDKHPGQVHGAATDKWGKWSAVVTKRSSGSGSGGGSNAGTGGTAF